MKRVLFLMLLCLFGRFSLFGGGSSGLFAQSKVPGQSAAPDYARQIQPLLHNACGGCHGKSSPQAGLSVMTRTDLLKGGQSGPAIVAGSSATSLLLKRVTGEIQPQMPQAASR
ncbi:MAG: c-type cytochrome domain-containing protein [Terriglobia bacterium]